MSMKSKYSNWFFVPALAVFTLFFLIPLLLSVYFSLTVWNFDEVRFIGLENFRTFLTERSLNTGIINTMLYAFLTCALKVVLGFLAAVFLTSQIRTKNLLRSVIFFPNLISTIAVGITFTALMHPTKGLINESLAMFGISGPDWLGNIGLALFSVIGVDVWKGVGVAAVIYIAGIQAIDKTYYEAAMIDGAGKLKQLRYITLPLVRPAMNSVILLSLIGGLRSFDLIWSMTEGGPGYATEVLASAVYKQYGAGYYGLSTAGNVIMFLLIAAIAFPLQKFLLKREVI